MTPVSLKTTTAVKAITARHMYLTAQKNGAAEEIPHNGAGKRGQAAADGETRRRKPYGKRRNFIEDLRTGEDKTRREPDKTFGQKRPVRFPSVSVPCAPPFPGIPGLNS